MMLIDASHVLNQTKHLGPIARGAVLLNFEDSPDLILWIRLLLCDRPQRDRLNGPLCRDHVLSDEIVVNTGAPKRFVLPQFCFQYMVQSPENVASQVEKWRKIFFNVF